MSSARRLVGGYAVTRRAVTGTCIYALVATAVSYAVLRSTLVDPVHRVHWLVISAVMIGADLLTVGGIGSGQSVEVDMSAVPVVVGTMFTSGAGMLGAALLAAVVSAVYRRPGWSGAVMDVATRMVAVGGCELVVWSVLGDRVPTPAGALPAVALGVLAYESAGLVGALMARAAPRHEARVYLGAVGLQVALVCAYNAVLGALAVSIGLHETWGLALLAAPAVFLGIWYRSVNTLRQRYATMKMLYRFTAQLSDFQDTEAIVTAALALCRQLLACQHAHLVMSSVGDATRWETPALASPTVETMAAVELEVLGGGASVLVQKAKGGASGSPGEPFEDLMAAPLSMGDSGAGVLVVANREVPGQTFDRDDLRMFEALSAYLGTALTSSRRREQLDSEVAARRFEALHDELTGLANRTSFSQSLTEAMSGRAADRTVAVLVMDLDRFKDINDSLGHTSGDLVLRELAARLDELASEHHLAARLGGDEFAFLLGDLTGPDEAVERARVISEEVSRPLLIGDLALDVRASIGIAMAPDHGTDPATLLQRADTAMYVAKASSGRCAVYDPAMEQDTKRRLTLGSSLRRAFDAGLIEVWYQPLARSATGWTSSCEALLRWREEDGFVPPDEFIPIAEHTGMIERMTWWTLEKALEELGTWRAEELCPSVAVNISTRCLQAPDFVSRVRDMVTQADIPPSALTLEITESLLLSDPDLAEDVLTQLAMTGVRVAIDDFGTGYSSLSRLKRLPVHTIKIDRAFVINMHSDRDDEAIVKATLEMARTLGCTVVAEGVETFEAWHRLQAFGCQQIQGFILAEPMPAAQCRQWLRRRQNLLDSVASGPT